MSIDTLEYERRESAGGERKVAGRFVIRFLP
jgi:hypothetical protein